MDLDEFERSVPLDVPSATAPNNLSTRDAIRVLDDVWWSQRSRAARWMDLIGDYAGMERFVIDGDALIQSILDDPLLGLAKENDLSFQLAHALHSLEKVLHNFLRRRAVFDVVFWESNGHLTRAVGKDEHAAASAALARTLLARHLQQNVRQHVAVHVFQDLEDAAWLDYIAYTKPMFVMTSDGGSPMEESEQHATCVLLQRQFVFQLLTSGTTVSIMRDVEFRQLKIFAFVFEGRREKDPRSLLFESVWRSILNARTDIQRLPTTASLKLSRDDGDESHGKLSLDASLSKIVKSCWSAGSLGDVEEAALFVFTAHCVLLEGGFVPLQDRGASNLERDLGEMLGPKLRGALTRFLPVLYARVNEHALLQGACPTFDIDARLFGRLLRFVSEKTSNAESVEDAIGTAVYDRVQSIWAAAGRTIPTAPHIADLPHHAHVSSAIASRAVSTLLPFDNSVFNAEIGDLHVDASASAVAPNAEVARFTPGAVYQDVRHWHNQVSILPRHQGGDSKPVSPEWMRQRALRREQRFMANFQKFAESLAGAASNGLQQQVIPSIATSTRPSKHASASQSNTPASSRLGSPIMSRATSPSDSRPTSPVVREAHRLALKGKGKPKALTKKEALLQQIQTQKASTRLEGAQKWWGEQLAQIEALPVKDRAAHVRSLAANKRVSGRDADPASALEFRLFQIHLDIQAWIADPNRASIAVHDGFAVSIVRQVLNAYKMPSHSTATLAALDATLTSLGFQSYIPSLHRDTSEEVPDRPLSFKFEKLIKTSKSASPLYKWMRIPDEEPVLWQLRVFGEYMERMFDSQPDKRVQFNPDAWQRKVLDALDADDSILVVAPTSAGKTFIAFYAMEKVLRETDDGILVYVAPTKALVNQIAADVHARFRKSRSGKNFWAIHSRDYRVNDPQNCQVLVTVPEILATMLLSPSLAKLWTPRIRRIILDEIHTIGEQESGPVWEQILLFAPCPIIGLSATIGRPEDFNAWLASVQQAHGFKHTFIHHRHRYSHLRKYIYLLDGQTRQRFSGLDDYITTDRTRFLHPIAILGWGTAALPSDFALEAQDTLSLYDALLQHKAMLPDSVVKALPGLHPTRFFASKQQAQLLRQQDVLLYEAELLRTIQPLLDDHSGRRPSSVSVLQLIIKYLKDPLLRDAEMIEDLNVAPSPSRFLDNLISLVADLQVSGDLPAILFAFDRSHCEIMARALLGQLEEAEARWKDTSPVWAQKIREWESWQARAKERERAQLRLEKMKLKRGDERGATETSQGVPESSWESSFDPDAPLEQFSFSGGNLAYLRSDLEQDIKDLAWSSVPSWALQALRRGVAVHHAGMNKAYRSLIERLFRLKFVRVMISTGTLALGINAPARTTVFCGDSPFLTALMYRQCAGRAGRRGYDLLGKVIFYGLPVDRIGRLVMSRLPALTGNFPLTSTLVLRLCNLLEGSEHADTAVRAVSSVLRLPHVAFGSPIGHQQLLHIVRFSIDYLRRAHLLDELGRPLNLFGIAGRLYYTEPSNLALVVLLQSGVIHRICNQASMIEAKRELMLVMCHMFGRRYLPRTMARRPKSASLVVLPPLPANVEQVLSAHGRVILNTFVSYAQTYATHHSADLRSQAAQLPLSGRSYTSQSNYQSGFMTALRESARESLVRCPFVATSGHDDNFSSVSELTHSAHDALHLDTQAIPSMDLFVAPASTTRSSTTRAHSHKQLNAYLLDFYSHGQVDTLVKENGIRRGDLWYALDDFSLSLRTVQAVLVEMLEAPRRETTAAPSGTVALPPRPKQSQDSWDVEEEPAPDQYADGKIQNAVVPAVEPPADVSEDEDAPLALGAKPAGLGAEDWRVLKVMSEVVIEFDTAFKKMWA